MTSKIWFVSGAFIEMFIRTIISFILQTIFLPLRLPFFLFLKLRSIGNVEVISFTLEGSYSEKPIVKGFAQMLSKDNRRFYLLIIKLYFLYRYFKKNVNKKQSQKKVHLLLSIYNTELGWAQLWELNQIIAKLQSVGLVVYSYLYDTSLKGYYLASTSDKIFVPPTFSLNFTGLGVDLLFIKDTLKLFGIEPNFLKLGKYKSAVERFTEHKASSFAKEQYLELFRDIEAHIFQTLKSARKKLAKSKTDFYKLQKKTPISAMSAYKLGFIDGICYINQVVESILSKDKLDTLNVNSKALSVVQKFDFNNLSKVIKKLKYKHAKLYRFRTTKKVALVVAEGVLVDSREPNVNAITYSDYHKTFQYIQSKSFDSIILRINSPGGSAVCSDLLWYDIMKLQSQQTTSYFEQEDCHLTSLTEDKSSLMSKKVKLDKKLKQKKQVKLYVSQSNVAASGGYYLSAVNRSIYSTPLSITGSIGVLAGKFNIRALLEKKLKMHLESLTVGHNTAIYSPLHNFSVNQKDKLILSLKNMYDLFCHRISVGRQMEQKDVEKLGEGRVYSGMHAKKVGLVDYEGGLFDIFETICNEYKISDNESIQLNIFPKIKPSIFNKQTILSKLNIRLLWLAYLEDESVFLDETLLYVL